MKTNICLLLFITILVANCKNEEKIDPFEISVNQIGLLTNEVKVNQLDSIFSNDSIAKRVGGSQSLANSNEIEIYEKGGAKLLVLEAKDESDPTSTIENIQVIDNRYKTNTGLSSGSTFKDIKDHYTVSKINNTLSAAVIFVDSIQAYFTIDKKELSKEFQYSTDVKIKSSDIPENAKIKHFWIHWDSN